VQSAEKLLIDLTFSRIHHRLSQDGGQGGCDKVIAENYDG
jgi:hypothetical protein